MPNTHGLAKHEPLSNDDEEREALERQDGERYFAVLALDGDQIGKWVAGDKCPPFRSQLAYTDASGHPSGALEYFERDSDPDGKGTTLKQRFAQLLDTRRPISPSYHLQFSEALSNFALLCARPIVEAFDGRLIYSGGDDVLALLPADTALDCARALRMAFKGDPRLPEFLKTASENLKQANEAARRKAPYYQRLAAESCLFDSPAQGFLARNDLSDQTNQKPIPFLVPGPAADCSVGLAIAHFKDPLQDVVREAQNAEKRAKKQLGRSAVAVTLMKRSGETIEWGCQWDSGGLDIYDAMLRAVAEGAVSRKFPHRVVELLDGYLTETTPLAAKAVQAVNGFPVQEVVLREFQHALDRQGQRKESPAFHALAGHAADLARYLATAKLNPSEPSDPSAAARAATEAPLRALIGLCQTVAFIARNLPDNQTNTSHPQTYASQPAERQPVS